ncbi:MAG: ROK family protein, partial [Actinomycetota bacterium]
ERRPVGVGVAGYVDRSGVVRTSPNLPGLVDAPMRDAIAGASGRAVVVDNDANAAAVGEATYGAARGASDVLLVTLGTGIGGGLVLGGRCYRGAHGGAGEIGHFTVDPAGPLCACGAPGHWEALASGTALGRRARERARAGGLSEVVAGAGGDPEAVTGEIVGAAARAGDPDAVAVVAEYADRVAIGLAGLVAVLDPAVVVVGGGVSALGEILLAPLRIAFLRHVEGGERRPPVAIVAAALGPRAGAIGAAVLAREAA